MSDLLLRLKKSSKIDRTNILSKSDFFKPTKPLPTPIYGLNVAMGASLKGGVTPGLVVWAGPSKHFKTSYVLLCLKAYLDSDPTAIGMWYDSEFGSPQSYFEAFGIDTNRVLHIPITNIEDLKFDLVNQLNEIKRGDKVMICVDSVGNLASKKEVEDAINEKAVADMTRAKQLKSLFRMVTPILTLKDLPLHVVNHTYQTQEMYSKTVVSGGTGIYYSANSIFIIGRQQEKDDNGLSGFNFVVNIEKSRSVREKKKISITVHYGKGINRWSGLLDIALESGHVIKPKNGWYAKVNKETGEVDTKNYREAHTNSKEFWMPIIEDPSFEAWINSNYGISQSEMVVSDDEIDVAVSEGDDLGTFLND